MEIERPRPAPFRHPGPREAGRAAVTGFAAVGASVALACLTEIFGNRPGPVATLLSIAAILLYLVGISALCAALLDSCARHPALTAAAWATLLVAARLALDPRFALAAIGRLPNVLLEDWLAHSRSQLWIAAIPVPIVVVAAACGALATPLALSLRRSGAADAARPAMPPEARP